MNTKSPIHAVALVSGGLDSRLAVRLVTDQGIPVVGLHFTSAFAPGGTGDLESETRDLEAALGIPIKTFDHTEELVAAIHAPEYGFGKNMNPCIDCRMRMVRRAHRYMLDTGASFLVTGEVAGQRPMSQKKHTMEIMDRRNGVEGLVLRPLSARVLSPTVAEQKGWVDRNRLGAVQGRSRQDQMAMAERLDVGDYPAPGGGCLLTLPEYAVKVKDAVLRGDLDVRHGHIFNLGRHFRLSSGAKAVVGRREEENDRLACLATERDSLILPVELPGPSVLVLNSRQDDDLTEAASLAGRYMKVAPGDPVRFELPDRGETFSAPAGEPSWSASILVGRHNVSPRGKDLPHSSAPKRD